jgi:hypothetical protein
MRLRRDVAEATITVGMRYWRGSYVIVFPGRNWKFHTCVLCGKALELNTPAARTGVGPECARRTSDPDLDRLRETALAADRVRFQKEVLEPGFKIE